MAEATPANSATTESTRRARASERGDDSVMPSPAPQRTTCLGRTSALRCRSSSCGVRAAVRDGWACGKGGLDLVRRGKHYQNRNGVLGPDDEKEEMRGATVQQQQAQQEKT